MSINPETNLKVRATLYVVGTGGVIHLATLLTISVIKEDLNYFHPLYTIDVDQLWAGSRDNYFIYSAGWVVFFCAIYFVFKQLSKHN